MKPKDKYRMKKKIAAGIALLTAKREQEAESSCR